MQWMEAGISKASAGKSNPPKIAEEHFVRHLHSTFQSYCLLTLCSVALQRYSL